MIEESVAVDLESAFAAGACAAYDDLGITEPPWQLMLRDPEIDAWKRGLASGYRDIEQLVRVIQDGA